MKSQRNHIASTCEQRQRSLLSGWPTSIGRADQSSLRGPWPELMQSIENWCLNHQLWTLNCSRCFYYLIPNGNKCDLTWHGTFVGFGSTTPLRYAYLSNGVFDSRAGQENSTVKCSLLRDGHKQDQSFRHYNLHVKWCRWQSTRIWARKKYSIDSHLSVLILAGASLGGTL